ncbi:rhodanese-like domain-containing protein [Kaistella palustris]|uniref:rhodanese-like domain-containing protein n=1 Tax=Kaistella palustris TaxID=493376 RepID=UPI000403E84C|nr:rhodanese-like domain-containing protein [Kaistella palustris]
MKTVKNYLKFAAIAAFAVSCTSAVPMVQSPRADMKEIVVSPETTLVDVRIPEQFNEKTAAGAINIPLAALSENIDFLKKQKQVVIFCNSGKQAGEAFEILKKNGVENVYNAKTLKNVEAIKNEK